MKGRGFFILAVCTLLMLAVSPVWGEEGDQKITTHPITAPEDQNQPAPAAAPAEPAAPVEAAAEPAAPAATEPQVEQKAAANIKIEDAVVCQDVVERSPVGSGDVFSKDIPRVFCYSKVVGMEGQGNITHNWYYNGSLKASVSLPVRSDSWRTWSSKTMTPEWAGEWMVEILSGDGAPLQSIVFFVQ